MSARSYPPADAPERRLAQQAATWIETHPGEPLPGDLAPALQRLAAAIDSTILAPAAGPAEIERLCEEAARLRFAAVCVSPLHVPLAARILAGNAVRVATVIGFPSGAHTTAAKAAEARDAVRCGAQELDMVIALGMLKSGGDDYVRHDVASVVEAADGRLVKVILETAALDRGEKIRAARAALAGGAAFLKTSTGFGPGGATLEDVTLLRAEAGPAVGVKASGGIRTSAAALRMIASGADRIGTSAGAAILSPSGKIV